MDVDKHFSSKRPENFGICQQKPKHSQYALLSKRQESFSTWPENASVPADELAECGFVYTGVADSVRCYHCGGGLRNWDEGDNPWVEHITWYPDCPHVKLVKGQGFVDRIKNSKPLESDCPLETEMQPASPLRRQYDLIDSVPAQSCIQMGSDVNDVQKAIKKYIELNGHSNFKGTDLYRIILEEEEKRENEVETDGAREDQTEVETDGAGEDLIADNVIDSVQWSHPVEEDERQESIEELIEENSRLKDSQRCKICMEDAASVIFLPCGHMVTCPQCAPNFVKCPMCREKVHGMVKAYFAMA